MKKELEKLIKNYKAPVQAKKMVEMARPVFLAGISGAGKDTIKNKLLEDARFYNLVSYATRPKRINNGKMEVDGIDYYFINDDQAIEMLKNNQFIEAKKVHATLKGTSLAEYQKGIDNNKIPITDIDVQGVDAYYKISSKIRPIFIIPPDFVTWKQRLSQRYDDQAEFEQIWPIRCQTAIAELNQALASSCYYWIINDDIETAIIKIKAHLFENQYNQSEQIKAKQIAKQILENLS